MADKAMEEVMREFEEKFGALNAGKIRHDAVYSYIPIACRSYARKVVEELEEKKSWTTISGNREVSVVSSYDLTALADRLTDKEPT